MAAFLAKRDGLAAGQGLPTGVAQSASATRQWVSDELTESARTVAERSREAGDAWLHRVWQRTLAVVWGSVAVLVIGEAVTAIGAGWSTARTAGLLAGLVTAALLTGAARFHRARGGVLAPWSARTTGSPPPARSPSPGCCSPSSPYSFSRCSWQVPPATRSATR